MVYIKAQEHALKQALPNYVGRALQVSVAAGLALQQFRPQWFRALGFRV